MARVLLIDNERDLVETMAMLLEDGGHTVAIAYSGPEAIARAPEFQPEVVIADLAMPGMDGYETCTRLRAFPELAGAHFVVLSGYGDEGIRRRSRAEGFYAHLVKPIQAEQLQSLIRSLGKV
jgi:CheY-like chemotaxis protein